MYEAWVLLAKLDPQVEDKLHKRQPKGSSLHATSTVSVLQQNAHGQVSFLYIDYFVSHTAIVHRPVAITVMRDAQVAQLRYSFSYKQISRHSSDVQTN